jgi:hypothetical protein
MTILIIGILLLHIPSLGAQEEIKILSATYCAGLTDNQMPIDPKWEFQRGERIYLSLQVSTSVLTGSIEAVFYFNEIEITRTSVPMADIGPGKKGYFGFSLNQVKPFPVGKGYRTDIFHEGIMLGTFYYSVVQPPASIPTHLRSTTFAKGHDAEYAPVNRTNRFRADEKVFLICNGDFGLQSWIAIEWQLTSNPAENTVITFTLEENAKDRNIAFSYLPPGGWPVGSFAAAISIDGEQMARLPFVIDPVEGQ